MSQNRKARFSPLMYRQHCMRRLGITYVCIVLGLLASIAWVGRVQWSTSVGPGDAMLQFLLLCFLMVCAYFFRQNRSAMEHPVLVVRFYWPSTDPRLLFNMRCFSSAALVWNSAALHASALGLGVPFLDALASLSMGPADRYETARSRWRDPVDLLRTVTALGNSLRQDPQGIQDPEAVLQDLKALEGELRKAMSCPDCVFSLGLEEGDYWNDPAWVEGVNARSPFPPPA